MARPRLPRDANGEIIRPGSGQTPSEAATEPYSDGTGYSEDYSADERPPSPAPTPVCAWCGAPVSGAYLALPHVTAHRGDLADTRRIAVSPAIVFCNACRRGLQVSIRYEQRKEQ
jgi:hypothetical protein